MPTLSYVERRGQIETYFDRTAAETWSRLTSDAPVGRIRATVREGRERMRATLLGWLPEDLVGRRLLDAGCGTGALAVAAAARGAEVVAVDLSAAMIGIARSRAPAGTGPGSIDFRVGDLIDASLGRFDHVVAMDSLIHYQPGDMADMVGRLAERCDGSVLFTFAPRTAALSTMHAVGRLFPTGGRAPSIAPVGADAIRRRLAALPSMAGWRPGRSERIMRGFYTSQAQELVRS